jgi:hypothetical protein
MIPQYVVRNISTGQYFDGAQFAPYSNRQLLPDKDFVDLVLFMYSGYNLMVETVYEIKH